jgi:hypothetical protein
MTQFVAIWVVLGVVTLALALYRKVLMMREDPYVHLDEGEQRMIPQQVATFRRIGAVDRWGITLTIVTAVFGIGLACAYLYQVAPR